MWFHIKKKFTKLHPPMVVGIILHKVRVSTQETFTEKSNNTCITFEYKHQIYCIYSVISYL
jgi:hypothetical protein